MSESARLLDGWCAERFAGLVRFTCVLRVDYTMRCGVTAQRRCNLPGRGSRADTPTPTNYTHLKICWKYLSSDSTSNDVYLSHVVRLVCHGELSVRLILVDRANRYTSLVGRARREGPDTR